MSRGAASIPPPERLLDLLADRATEGLDQGSQAELDDLLRACPGVDADALERAAAALDLALFAPSAGLGALEPLPASVREHISRGAQNALAPAPIQMPRAVDPAAARARPSLGWLIAAAVAIIAVVGWWPSRSAPPVAVSAGRRDSAAVAAFQREHTDARSTAWQAGTDATGAACAGEVVWSPSAQQGFMVFRGLRANDPGTEQYQLWIFDKARDERFPVHGGVFDAASGETVVPIEPRLGVPEATTFVVTVERPGGVWVSDRSRIAAVASVAMR